MNGDHDHLGLLTLTPTESKRLLAEAVAVHPAVVHAFHHGTIMIGVGTTNAVVVERLTGQFLEPLRYSAGIVRQGELDVIPKEDRLPPLVLRKGRPVSEEPDKVLADFGLDDVMIKGANAVDMEGVAGVLLGSREGGTIGRSLGIILARGATLLMPVGLEKLIPSVPLAVEHLGQDRIAHATGMKVGMMPVIGAEVMTEIDALHLLAGVHAVLVAAGGWAESQGSVTLAVHGSIEEVETAVAWANFVKGRSKERPA